MRTDKVMWVELSEDGAHYVRIFKNQKAVAAAIRLQPRPAMTLAYYKVAVSDIRHQVWMRCEGHCELCGDVVTESSGQMHELKHRGQGGEISLSNSVFICPQCHGYQHRDRNPKFTRPLDKTRVIE